MRGWIARGLLLAVGLSSLACILRPGTNPDCVWPPEEPRKLVLANAADRRHLVIDAELTTMNQYYVAATSNFNVRLAGTDRIAARFEGTVAPDSNGDMVGVGLLNFWKGTVQSEFVQFQP